MRPPISTSPTRSRTARFRCAFTTASIRTKPPNFASGTSSQAHELEAWGDARAYDGTVSIIQPLIAPLYNGKSALEFVALLSGQADATGYDLVRAYWQKQHAGADFEQFWRKSLHDGWIEGTAFAAEISHC